MNIKTLEKASKIIEQIKKLDAEIIELDKYAMKLINSNSEINLTLSFDKENNESDKVNFDEDGSLINMPRMEYISPFFMTHNPLFGAGGFCGEPKKQNDTETLNRKLSESATLKIIGIILIELNDKRNDLISKVNKIGIQL